MRLRWTAAGLILGSGLMILAAALVLGATSGSGSAQVSRPAVTVQQLRPAYHGPSGLVGALTEDDARALALARVDLDADGAEDLVVGYALRESGVVTIQRGNPDAFAPKRRSVFERMQAGFVPDWVASDARAVRVPEPVSYLATGDFNRDRRPDVLAAARGGGLYLLRGDGKGSLRPATRVPLPGPVTVVAAGEFRVADGHPDVAVGVATPRGPELLLYDGVAGAKLAKPMRLALPGEATGVRFGSLDPDPYMDLAVAAGGRLEIVHGWGRRDVPGLESRVERLAAAAGVRALSVGYFMRNRDGRNEIAAAFSDGTVRLLIPSDLDTRPATAKTIRDRAAARVKARRIKRQEAESEPAWRSSTSSGWEVGPSIARGAGGALPQRVLTSAKVSLLDTDDLLVAKAAGGVELVPARGARAATRKAAAAVEQLNDAVDAPTAILPMPQKANGERGIVALSDQRAEPSMVTLAASTLTVDRTDDPAGAGLTAASACTAAANDCSLRGAVQFANNPANAGSTILLGANTYTLSINGDRGCVGGGEPAATGNTVGDLEINQSTTITGVGAPSTIIRQTGTGSASAPGDRVMCLNTGFLVGLQYSFSGLTITGGREGGTVGGGGIIGGELNNSVTLSGVALSNNQDANSGLGGGGIQITGGSLTITNSLIGGSSPPCTAATSLTCASGTDRSNVNLANSAQTSGGGVNYTPSSPMHAGGTGTLTVTGSTITRNTSSGIGGGGFDLSIFAFASPGGIGSGSASISTSTISNNTATGNGGGILVESLPTTVASTTLTANSSVNSGGGAYVGGGGLTLDGTSAPGVTFSGNTAPSGGSAVATTFNVTVQGTNVTLGGDVLIAGGGNWTNTAGTAISPTNLIISGGTFNANDSTTNVSGNFAFGPTPGNEVAFPGTFNSGTGTFNFNGSGAQGVTGPNSPTFNNLVVNKPSGTLTLGVNSSVKGNLTVASGVFDLGAFTANRTAAGGTLTVSNGATLKIGGANSLPANYATRALGPSSTVEYSGTSGQTIAATSYGNLTSSSTGARTLPSGQTIGVAGAFTPGTNAYTVTGSTVDFNGAGGQTIPAFPFNNLTSSSTGARALSGVVGVAGVFTPGTNAYTVAGSTVNFNGAGAQTIPAFGFNNLTSSSTGARTLSGTVGVAGTFTPGTNAYTVTGSTVDFNGAGAQTIPAFSYNNLTSSSTGARTLSGTIGVAGAFTPGTNAYTVAGSTVNFNGAGGQTIPAFSYNNLTSSSTGARTLAPSGTIAVAGTFTPGANAYTVAGSTVNFDGEGGQTIPAFGYHNLASSSTGARTLSGTIGVAGAFTPGTNAYTVAGSTVNFNGAGAQTIPAFGYHNLTSSSTGARTLAPLGTIGVAAVFTPGTNVYTVTGSIVSFNGSAPQSVPAFTFDGLTDANVSAPVSLTAATSVNGALTVNAGAVLDTGTSTLTAGGAYTNNGQIRHSANQALSTTAGPFAFGDGLGVETLRLSSLSAPFGSTTASTAAGGSNPFDGCGALPANAVRRFWQVTPAASASGVARFSFRTDEVAAGLTSDQLAIYRCVAGGSWTQVGATYTRPSPGGPLAGHTSVEATAVPFVSTGATYVVAQGSPDLTVVKTNNVSGTTTVHSAWTWKLHVSNGGTGDAVLGSGQTIVSDNLPGSGIGYGTPSVANVGSGVTGGANISCAIASNDLTCVANGGAVTLGGANGAFDIVFTATPASAVTFTNPRAGGACGVDPNNASNETNEGNNACSDSVAVGKSDTTTTITSDDPDPSGSGQAVTVEFTIAPAAGGTPTGNVQVSDGVDSCTGTVAGGSCILSLTTGGTRTLTAHYLGDAGFNESTSAGVSHTVDTVPPDTAIDDNPSDRTNAGSASFGFSGTDVGSGVASFECRLDGGGFSPCTSPKDYAGLLQGSHTFEVRAIDGAGNADPTPASFTWTVDTTAPDTAIGSKPPDTSGSSTASFGFTGSSPDVAGFECKLDGGDFAACVSPKSYSGLADGSHTFQVRAIDDAGNADASPASFSWTIANTEPDTTLASKPSNPSATGSASFGFSGVDGGSGVAGFECKLDGAGFAACTSPKGYAGLADGSHTFQVRAIGGEANPDATPASYTWTVDTIAPAVTVDQAPGQPDPTGAGPIHFRVVFAEPVTGFAAGDVSLGGTAGATHALVTGSGKTYDVAVSGMTGAGTVIASVPANAASDAAGHGNTASTSSDNTVTYEVGGPPASNSAPTATITGGHCRSANGAHGTLDVTLFDPDGDALSLAFDTTSNRSLVPSGAVVLGGSAGARTITVTAAAKKRGTAILGLHVSDGTVSVPVTITVRVGNRKDNVLGGTVGPDVIFGRGGNDRLKGLGGDDLLCGGKGRDKLNGGDGRDTLNGNGGKDVLKGAGGDDSLTGGAGGDKFRGGPGTDVATDFNAARGDKQDGTIP